VRCESSLLYFNVDYVRDRILQLLAVRQDRIRLVVFYLGQVPHIDLAGAEFVAELQKTLSARGISLRLAEAHGELRDALRRIEFAAAPGNLESGQTVDAVLSHWRAEEESNAARSGV
jgi:MFS superfamily sulfate permease-like transporter